MVVSAVPDVFPGSSSGRLSSRSPRNCLGASGPFSMHSEDQQQLLSVSLMVETQGPDRPMVGSERQAKYATVESRLVTASGVAHPG